MTTAEHIRKCRACAQSKNVWDSWTMQMCLKTIYRDAFARRSVPVDASVSKHIQAVNDADDELLGNPSRVKPPKRLLSDATRSITADVEAADDTETIDAKPKRTRPATGKHRDQSKPARTFSDCKDPDDVAELEATLAADKPDDEKLAIHKAAKARIAELEAVEETKHSGELFQKGNGD